MSKYCKWCQSELTEDNNEICCACEDAAETCMVCGQPVMPEDAMHTGNGPACLDCRSADIWTASDIEEITGDIKCHIESEDA